MLVAKQKIQIELKEDYILNEKYRLRHKINKDVQKIHLSQIEERKRKRQAEDLESSMADQVYLDRTQEENKAYEERQRKKKMMQ